MQKNYSQITTASLSGAEARELKALNIGKEKSNPGVMDDDYAICIVNMSNHCLTIAGFRRRGGSDAEWKWNAIPKTCRNCFSNYNQCCNEKKWSVIEFNKCNAAPYDLFVGYDIGGGNARGVILDVDPDCSAAGGVWGIVD